MKRKTVATILLLTSFLNYAMERASSKVLQDDLRTAIKYKKRTRVALLLEQDAKLNELYSDGLTPLLCAISSGDQVITRLLLKKGSCPNQLGGAVNNSPLYLATKQPTLALAELLLNYKANPNARISEDDCSHLINAIELGHLGLVRLLLEYGADPNMAVDGRSARAFAVQMIEEPYELEFNDPNFIPRRKYRRILQLINDFPKLKTNAWHKYNGTFLGILPRELLPELFPFWQDYRKPGSN